MLFDPAQLVTGVITLYTNTYKARKESKKVREYEAMIAASQAKLAETTLVPGFTNVYA